MIVSALVPADYPLWDAFVENCSSAGPFHLTAWKDVLESCFPYRTFYLYAHDGRNIMGVLPLVHVNTRLFGNALISVPFAVEGGIAADNEQARQLLQKTALVLAESLRVDHLELRQTVAVAGQPAMLTTDLYAGFCRQLPENSESLLQWIPRKQRAVVRKARAQNLQVSHRASLDDFYACYSLSLRNLGTPVLHRAFYARIAQVFGARCRITAVYDRDGPVASVMSFCFRDRFMPFYGGGGELARRLRANDRIYWELMQLAMQEGYQYFDFGRSKRGTGAYHYKQHWGFQPQPFGYQYYPVLAAGRPEVNPLNPRYRLMVAGWKRLPVAMSQMLGPAIASQLA